jgi:hypothetical protein
MQQKFENLQSWFSDKISPKQYLKSSYANIPDQKKTYKGGEDSWICTD